MNSQELKNQYPAIYGAIVDKLGDNNENFHDITEIKEIAYNSQNGDTLYKICDNNADFWIIDSVSDPMLFEDYEEQYAYENWLPYSEDKAWEVAKMAAMNHADKLPDWTKSLSYLPKSAIYYACSKIDGFDISSLDYELNFIFDEITTEQCGYYIFDDGSLYGYNGGDPEIWSDYRDYVEEIILPLDEENLQSADVELLNLYKN